MVNATDIARALIAQETGMTDWNRATASDGESHGRMLRKRGRGLVLLVDSDHDARARYAQCLRQHAFGIDEVDDGRVALARAISQPASVVVCTVEPAGFSGFDLCELLRRDGVTKDAVLVLLGDAAQDAVRGVRAGADVVLSKPVDPLALLEAIVQAQQHPRPASDEEPVEPKPRRRRRVSEMRTNITTQPPREVARLYCEECDETLDYQRSYVGGVDVRNPEHWDIYRCPNHCATYRYRRRTRRLTRYFT